MPVSALSKHERRQIQLAFRQYTGGRLRGAQESILDEYGIGYSLLGSGRLQFTYEGRTIQASDNSGNRHAGLNIARDIIRLLDGVEAR